MTLVDLSTLNTNNLEAILLKSSVYKREGWYETSCVMNPDEVEIHEDWTYLRDTERRDQWGDTLQISLPTELLTKLITTGRVDLTRTIDGCKVTDTWTLTIE